MTFTLTIEFWHRDQQGHVWETLYEIDSHGLKEGVRHNHTTGLITGFSRHTEIFWRNCK